MKKILVLTALTMGTLAINAQDTQITANTGSFTSIQLSLTPDIALYPKTTTVNGLSLSIWGENPQHGVAIGFVNGSTGESSGFSWGLVNYDDNYTGVQWAFINYSRENFLGWQSAFINVSQGQFTGFQEGWLNVSEQTHGFQLGLVNYAQQLDGLQVGFINVAMNNGWFDELPNKLATGFPIVNWSF